MFTILSGDGVSAGGGVAGVLQGDTSATRKFTGDNSSVVFPLTTVTLTAASRVDFNANLTSGGVSVLAFGRTAFDRNGADGLTAADVFTGSSTSNSVIDIVARASSTTTTTADSATIVSLAANSADSVTIAAAAGGTIRVDLSAKPVDRDGNLLMTATGDIVSVTVRSGDGTALPFAITGDSPGVATGGSIIINIDLVNCGANALGCTTITTTYLRYSATLVAATTLTMASALTDAEAKATAGWNGKIPRDSGLAQATAGANGAYSSGDITVVVDGRTLSSGDYIYNVTGAEAHLLRIDNVTAQNIPNAAANNIIVGYKSSEFDGTLVGTSINTPFGTVTATAGPNITTQESIPVFRARSLTGLAGQARAGTVRLNTADLNTVVVITFPYDKTDTAKKLASVSTPTAVGAGKSRSPDGTESGPNTNKFEFKVALLTVDDINSIDTGVSGLTAPNTTIADLVGALAFTGSFNTRIGSIATGASGLALDATSAASAFAALLVPIRDGETVTITYNDADAGAGAVAAVTKTATVDLKAPTITIDKPTDKSFAGAQSTLQITINDGGAGLKLTDVTNALRTSPQVSGNIVASSTLASTNEYSLSQTAQTAAPIPEGKTTVWAGDPNNDRIKDAVGNEPKGSGAAPTDSSATRGTRANPFAFTVDKAAPTLLSARTGGKVETDPTSARVNEIVADDKAKDAITVLLDLGIGGAPVDADSVSPADFEVTTNPTLTVIDVIVGATLSGDATKQNILLRLEQELATDAKPVVKLVGTLSDQAANDQTNVTLSDQKVVDALRPVLTASIAGDSSSNPVSRDQVIISVSSTEAGTITGTARYVAGSGDQTLGEDTGPGAVACGRTVCGKTLSFTSIGTNEWTSTVKINTITSVAVASGLVNVRLTVTDDSGNAGTAGLGDPDGTTKRATAVIDSKSLVFEFDNKLNNGVSTPNNIFVLSPETGTTNDHKTDTAAPFITVEFKGEANEYAVVTTGAASGGIVNTGESIKVDTHSDVDLTSAVMTMPDGTTKVDMLTDFKRSAANRFVMRAKDLALGNYTMMVQAKDSQGNVSAKDVPTAPGKTTSVESFKFTFTVTERAKYTVRLVPGLNLVSVPGRPANTDINSVIGADDPIDLITTYHPNGGAGPLAGGHPQRGHRPIRGHPDLN